MVVKTKQNKSMKRTGHPESNIVIFTSAKGGSGCSFLANVVASYMAQKTTLNVLLLDMNTGRMGSRIVFDINGPDVRDLGDLIVKPGDINIDFADITVVMQNSGNALLGIGYGAGEKRAVDAARKAIENPLLETNIDKATSIIFAVAGGTDLTPTEVQEAANVIEEIIDADVNMI